METLLSVDVSKDTIESAYAENAQKVVQHWRNHAQDRQELIALAKKKRAMILVEATGSYHLALVVEAQEAGLQVAVLNPARVRAYAQSVGQRSKTDPLDAQMILGCGSALQSHGRLVPMRKLEPSLLLLKKLMKQRELLVKHRAAQTQAGISRKLIAALDEEVRHLDGQILKICMQERADLYQRIRQIPQVGPVSAAYLVALLWDPSLFPSAEAIAAYCGLDVVLRQSGRYHGKCKLSKKGWAPLRQSIVCGLKGCAATRCTNDVAKLYRDFMNRDTNPLKWIGAACAVARKIVQTAWSMASKGTHYDPQRFRCRPTQPKIA